jgi:two-component system chemotaxis response regulator CheY
MAYKKDIDWKNIQVLIVDDQKVALDVLHDMLHEMGIDLILEAKDGQEALDTLKAAGLERIDLVISDWNMPNMDGFELLKRFRSFSPDKPFLLVTCRNDMASIVEAKKFGVSGYIMKPFSLTELDKKITAVLSA